MPHRAAAFVVALLVACRTLAAVFQARSPSAQPLTPGTFYAVAAGDSSAEFAIDGGGRYALIISSLDDAARSHPVQVRTSDAPIAREAPLRPLGREWRSIAATPVGFEMRSSYRCTPPKPRPVQSRRVFDIHVGAGPLDHEREYVRVPARLIAEGTTSRVYLDEQLTEKQIATGLAEEITRQLADAIVPALEPLGDVADVDGDGKLCILLTPWLSKLQGGRTRVSGFVRSADFLAIAEPPLSNRADVVYLNSDLQVGENLAAVLAHECTHVVCFSERLASDEHPQLPFEEDWLSEAIAHVVETRVTGSWSNLQHRIDTFHENPQQSPLVVADYYRAGLWRHDGCRGATFEFLQWCLDEFGEDMLPRLLQAPASGAANLELVTGVPFEDLYRRWTVSMYESGSPRVGRWNAIGELTIDMRGTSAAYVEVEAAAARRVLIDAPPGARLQVTIARFADSHSIARR